MRRSAPNFCQYFGEVSEFTTNVQRTASALGVYRAQTQRVHCVQVKKFDE